MSNRWNVTRSFLAIAIALMIIVGATFLAQRSGAALPHPSVRDAVASCWDYDCTGLDPNAAGCSGGWIDGINGSDSETYSIRLWWSDSCGANWGSTWPDICNPVGGNYCPSGVLLEADYGGQESSGWHYDWNTYLTTMLSGASSHDRVCRLGEQWICTRWW